MAIKGATAIKTKSSPTMGLADPAYKEQAKQFGEEKRKAGEETLGAINLLEQDVAQQEGEIAKAKYEQEKTKLAATQKAEEEYAGTTRGLYERAATLEEKYPFPTYKPTQEDALSYAQLGSMVVTLGMMLGGGAKASGKSALASMTGMINGWREGKQDLWRREAQQFDKDMQRIKSEREAIQKNLEKGLKLAATDRKAAQAYIDMASHIAGQGVVQAMINKGRPIAALKHLQETLKFQQKTFDEIENRAIAQQRHEQLMKAQEAQRQATLQAAQTKAGEKQQKVTQQQFIVQRAVNALGGVESALETIVALPQGSTTGWLPNLQTKDGMFNAIRNQIGRKISPVDAEFMNTLFSGIGRNLASIEASGTATGLTGLANQLQSGVYINAGVDDPYKVAMKLADIRRIATENIRPAINSGLMPPQQAEEAERLVRKIEKIVPYSTLDVANAYRQAKGDSRETIGEATSKVTKQIDSWSDEKERRLQELKRKSNGSQ
jgi:hypothetical protein